MVAPVVIAALISAAVAVGTTVEANKRQKKANRAQQRINASRSALERRQEVRSSRIERARVESASAAQGTTGSSSQIGVLGSITSQTATNRSSESIASSLAGEASSNLQAAANIRGVGGVVASFAASAGPTLFGG